MADAGSNLPWEVREHLYAVEEFLQRYPHHPEGRLLRDQLLQASQFVDSAAKRPAPAMQLFTLWPLAVVLLLLALLLAIV